MAVRAMTPAPAPDRFCCAWAKAIPSTPTTTLIVMTRLRIVLRIKAPCRSNRNSASRWNLRRRRRHADLVGIQLTGLEPPAVRRLHVDVVVAAAVDDAARLAALADVDG